MAIPNLRIPVSLSLTPFFPEDVNNTIARTLREWFRKTPLDEAAEGLIKNLIGWGIYQTILGAFANQSLATLEPRCCSMRHDFIYNGEVVTYDVCYTIADAQIINSDVMNFNFVPYDVYVWPSNTSSTIQAIRQSFRMRAPCRQSMEGIQKAVAWVKGLHSKNNKAIPINCSSWCPKSVAHDLNEMRGCLEFSTTDDNQIPNYITLNYPLLPVQRQ